MPNAVIEQRHGPLLLLALIVSTASPSYATPAPIRVRAAASAEESEEDIAEAEAEAAADSCAVNLEPQPVLRARVAAEIAAAADRELLGADIENTPAVFRPASTEGQRRLAVDELLLVHGSRIKDPDIKALLESIVDGSISPTDPRLTTYADLIQDIVRRSATLARLEQTDTMSHVEDSLREDLALGYQARSIEEILRPADLHLWQRLLRRLRPPRIAFNNAPQFTRDLMEVEPELRLRSLKRSARHMPILSPLEIITILRIFPAGLRQAALNLLIDKHGGTAGDAHHYDIAQIARSLRLAPEATKFFLRNWVPKRSLPRLRALAIAASGEDAKTVLSFLDESGTTTTIPETITMPQADHSSRPVDQDLEHIRSILRKGVSPEVQVDQLHAWLKKQKSITEESLLFLLDRMPRGVGWGWGTTNSKTPVTAYAPLEALFVKYGHTNWGHVGWEPMDRLLVVKALQLVRWTSKDSDLVRAQQRAYDAAVDVFRQSSGFSSKKDAYKIESESLLHHLVHQN